MLGFLTIPWLGNIGPSVSACDHRPQKILGAANVDLGLVSSGEARANQTQVNISPPKFFVGLACATRTKFPLPNWGSCLAWAVVALGQFSPLVQLSTWAVVTWAVDYICSCLPWQLSPWQLLWHQINLGINTNRGNYFLQAR